MAGTQSSGNASHVTSNLSSPGQALIVGAIAVSDTVDSATSHPLDPLSAVEIHRVAELCRAYAEQHGCGPIRFNTIGLKVSYIVICIGKATAAVSPYSMPNLSSCPW